LAWANYSGLPDSWRARIEQELAKEGLYLEIGALSYLPLRGISASDVKVFSDPDMQDEVSQLEYVLLDIDKSRLARGKLHFNQIELRNAQLNMPIDPSNPTAGSLVVESASGTLLMGGSKQFEIRSARGRISGIDVRLNAKIQSRRPIGQSDSPERKPGQGRQLLAQITKELARWEFDPDQAPQLVIVASADLSRRESLEARLELSAENFGKQGHRLEMLHAKAIIQGELLTVTQLEARDSRGQLDARMDFSLNSREGRFDVTSTLEIPPLLSAWIDLPPLPGQIVIGGGQAIEAQGELHLPAESKPSLRMTGQFHAESVMLRGLLFDHAESAFAWDDGNLFLRNLHLTRPDGEATGKALMLWPELSVAVHSTLPAADLRPIFQGQALDSILSDITPRESAALNLHLEGSFDLENTRAWACTGEGTILNSDF
ncbi:MAG: hypothetical protein ACO3RV_09935, partial [Luteolibacter sp.]